MVRITVINKHGVVLADSRANPNTMENHLNRPEIQDALKKHLGKETRFSNTLKHDFLYVATPIYLKDELVGFIRTSYYLDYINALFNKLIYDLLKIVTVISLILLAGVYFFARRITIPLSKLSGAVKEVAEGNFETQVIVQSKDEIGELSENFNIMSKKLKILFDEVNKQKEESKRLEKIKKDFITNVSHELKTPLTAIKGFIETLEDEIDDPDNKHYIEIISRNTDRLINIVQDLLLLTELEDEAAANKLMLSNVDIRIILENVRLLFTQKLIEKGLYFKIMADDNLPNVFVDSYRFEQLFINLLSNSIKYTENGGITIELKKSESKFIIICSDTGVGIPLEDQDRIFERFYISEKSRSRKYDGTGIGLSIVKHILMLHNGTIELDKEYRNGTRFIITI
jgi:signal transduction histidine kinase